MIRPLSFASILLACILPLFTLQAQPASKPQGSSGTGRAVAIVNGQKVPYKLYEDLYRDQLSYQKKIGQTGSVNQATDDALFLQLVDAELVRQEAARLNVKVTRDQAFQALLKDPPDFIKSAFIDDKGVFLQETFRQVVLHPELIGRIAQKGRSADEVIASWKADLEKVVVYMQAQETKRILKEKLYAAKPLTPEQIRRRYVTEKTRFNGSFIRVLYNTVPDSLAPVTGREAHAWYDSHLDDYRFASARQLASMILSVVPSSADSTAHSARIAAARDAVLNSPMADRPNIISGLLRDLPPNRFPDQPVNIVQIPKEIRDAVRGAKVGDMIGPFAFDKEDVLFFIEDTVTTTDTMLHARHVLIKVKEGDIGEDTNTRNMLTLMKSNITSKDLFLQAVHYYSQDPSAQHDGDLGYFGRGMMVPVFDSAAYNSPVGKAIGPVRSRFGYHLIWVDERITTGYKIRELRFPFAPSPGAIDTVRAAAVAYAQSLHTNIVSDSMFFAFKAKYPRTLLDTSLIHRLDIYGDALAPANFAFNADSGDVGVFSLPGDRVMITKLIYSYPTGIAPYDKILWNFVVPHVQRVKQLDLLAPRMKALADTITPGMTLGNIRVSAPWAEAFVVQNQRLTSPPDEDTTMLDSAMDVARDSSVVGPVRGKNGFYFLRVLDKTEVPTAADFKRDRESFTQEFTSRIKETLFTDMMIKARQYAVVEDLRQAAAPDGKGDY